MSRSRPYDRTRVPQACIIAIGAAVVAAGWYSLLIPHHSGDADLWFVPWLNHIVAHGPVQSLAEAMPVTVEGANGLGNYTPPYLYVLIVASLAHESFEALTLIKLVAIVGALGCCVSMYWLLRAFVAPDRALAAAASVLLLPTVVLNVAAWGQVDAYYSFFALIAVAAAMRERWVAMMIALGLALSFKLQAAFIGPFILYVLISRRLPLWLTPIPLIVYAGAMLPAWLCGRPAWELATIYLDQAHTWPWLSMNVPNPWAVIQYLKLLSYEEGVAIGLALGLLVGLGLASLGLRYRLEGTDLLLLALASSALLPYVLPKMHDRYFFMADLLSFALAVARPGWRTVCIAVAIQLGSLGAYVSHLWGLRVGTAIGALLIGLAILTILAELARSLGLRTTRGEPRHHGVPQPRPASP
jgi:Gpi18-like mannosyltransferase